MISKVHLTLCWVIFSICISCSVEKKVMRQTSNYSWFPFHWYSGTVSGRYFDKLAITLPIRVNSLKGNFTAQFDLGSNASSVYGNPLKNYFQTDALIFLNIPFQLPIQMVFYCSIRFSPKSNTHLSFGDFFV